MPKFWLSAVLGFCTVLGCGRTPGAKSSGSSAATSGGSGSVSAVGANATAESVAASEADPSRIDTAPIGLLFAHNADGSVRIACTGTLIRTGDASRQDIVLTAKHCAGVDSFYLGAGKAIDYPTDHDWQAATQAMASYAVIDHSDLDSSDVDTDVCPHPASDVQVLLLDHPATTIQPALLALQAPQVGDRCQFFGYGVHPDAASGSLVLMEQHALTIPIASISALTLGQTDVSAGAPAVGDSGGPLFCGTQIAATDSCGDGPNVASQTNQSFSRIDVKAAQINAIIAQWDATIDTFTTQIKSSANP